MSTIFERKLIDAIKRVFAGNRVNKPEPEKKKWSYEADNPDTLYKEGSTTFIYKFFGDKLKQPLICRSYPATHQSLYNSDKTIRDNVFSGTEELFDGVNIADDGKRQINRDDASKVALIGRVSADKTVISLWNVVDSGELKSTLTAMLKEMVASGVVDKDASLIVPGMPRNTVSGLVSGDAGDGEALEPWKRELYKKLHTLTGTDKKKAMERLGLGGAVGDAGTWHGEARRAGITIPGQKLWAMHSESMDHCDGDLLPVEDHN